MPFHDDPDEIIPQINRAIESEDFESARNLLEQHSQFLRLKNGCDTWLSSAARSGQLEAVKFLVDYGIGVNEQNHPNMPDGPIYDAACEGHSEVVRWLLEHGAEIHTERDGKIRCMPLLGASRKGHFDVVKVLVEHGADVNATWQGVNAYMNARDFGFDEIAEYLKSKGARDIRETAPPDYESAHAQIVQHLAGPSNDSFEWIAELSGDPEIRIGQAVVKDEDLEPRRELFTVGLSDRRLPTERDEFTCAELRIHLPESWNIEAESWPLEWMKRIAADIRGGESMPPEGQFYLGDDPAAPLAQDVGFSGWVVMFEEGACYQLPDYRWVTILDLQAIFPEEVELIKTGGTESFAYRLGNAGISQVLDPKRPNAITLPDPYEEFDDEFDEEI